MTHHSKKYKMKLELTITIFTLGIALFIMLKHYKKTKNKLTTEIEKSNKLNSDLEKYSGIISIENEIELKNNEFSKIQENATVLSNTFIAAKLLFNELEKDIKIDQNFIYPELKNYCTNLTHEFLYQTIT